MIDYLEWIIVLVGLLWTVCFYIFMPYSWNLLSHLVIGFLKVIR